MAHSVLAAVPPALPLPLAGLAVAADRRPPPPQLAARAAAAFQPRAPPAA